MASGALLRAGAALRLPQHDSSLQGADQALWERIRAVIDAAGARPPTIAEIAMEVKVPARIAKALLVRVAQQQQAWRISEERFARAATVHVWAAHAIALGGAGAKNRFTAAQFRDASGAGRNLSIEILEFFDRVKFTRRLGDARLLQCAASQIFGEATRD